MRPAGETELMRACGRRDLVEVRVLLFSDHADVSAQNEHGQAALHYAAWSGDVAVVEALLDSSAEIGLPDRCGDTALKYATRGLHLDVVQLLLSRGAAVDAGSDTGVTPLMNAASAGNLEAAKLLLKFGANLQLKDPGGMTAVHYSIHHRHPLVTAYLVANGGAEILKLIEP